MSMSTSRASYTDCITLFNRALEAPRGIKIKCPTPGAAKYLAQRFHYARKLDRDNNNRVYVEGDPMHNNTVFAAIKVSVQGTEVHLVKLSADALETEEL